MKCKVDGCLNQVHSKGLCRKHYLQMYRHNKILTRTRHDPNEIILHNTYAEMYIYHKSGEKSSVKIDIDDVEKVKKYKWSSTQIKGKLYVNTKIKGSKGKMLFLSHYIMNFSTTEDNKLIVYRNKDTLDNRKENLILKDRQYIHQNTKLPTNNKSGVKGVFKHKHGKWQANIGVNGQSMYLGLYDTFDEAVTTRKAAEIKYHTKKERS